MRRSEQVRSPRSTRLREPLLQQLLHLDLRAM
ncbi:hypothetical protein Ae168Ps1_1900c [Pseudonocardia sp. Ae168_Ps1]|nr:hypothetical protein Ae150APs1_1901c [Pseudonocardia sp. Ae150A_Ps1]OLL79494.1 hypothetical protein Ae168Ps1_1900c [Pseudonocardia sp. Ae168_Ps1]OLL86366.1 hypothetical protein Ae263Ps1_3421 [Pseudonocardia sp. Ae263_Ps1]OLL93590.1 hypothetical protein Ae356Ps1_3487c [Pseudonocardia sp. Ae356_Ps1]